MALPTRPSGGLPERPLPDASSLPSLPDIAPRKAATIENNDPLAPYINQFQEKFGRRPNSQELAKIQAVLNNRRNRAGQPNNTGPTPANPPHGGSGVTPPPGIERTTQAGRAVESTPIVESQPDENGWITDPATGKKHKVLGGFKRGVKLDKKTLDAGSNGKIGLNDLRSMLEDNDEFELDDLNGSAEIFMAHLRVPPDKEEQKRLIAMRAERQRVFDKLAEAESLDDPDDSNEDSNE